MLMLDMFPGACPCSTENGEEDGPRYSEVQQFAGVSTPESLLPSIEVRMTREWS